LPPYSKLQYWLDATEKTTDYKGSPYQKYIGKALKSALHQHNDLVAVPVEEKRKRIYHALLNHDQDVALAIFFLIIDPETYKLDLTKDDFSNWKTIPTKLEFDHKGRFEKVVRTFWKYEGASQSLLWQVHIIQSLQRALIFSGVADAREQLARRFMLIDAVARIGFNATIIFSGKIYVPHIDKGQTTFYETPGMPESSFSVDVSHPIDVEKEEDPDTAPKAINPPGDLKGYTVIEVLAPDIEFEHEN